MCDRCEPRPFPIRVTGATTRPTSTCHCVDVAMGSYDNTVSMRTPFDLDHRTDHWVIIDTCIATEIGWLWHQGVVTLNSCCGHGKLPPSVIVAEEHYDLMDSLGYEWELTPSGRRAHQLTSPTDTGDNGLRAALITATMIERLAKSKYERFDSHFSMPGGLTWDEYLIDDPSGALFYINDAAADLNAVLAPAHDATEAS